MDVDVRTLRWFQLASDGVTLTELSELERVSQPGISRALTRLEEEVGVPLLRRHGRTLRMTAAGAAFKKEVDEMLHRLDDGLAAASQAVDPERGAVRLAFQPSLASWLVPLLIRSFREFHPAVTFALLEVRGPASLVALESGDADLVVGIRRLDPRRVRRLRLMDQPLILAVAPDHPLASRDSLPLSEAADETFLMLRADSSLGAYARQLCRAAGFEPEIGFESEDISTLRGFVAAGLGVAILPVAGGGTLDGLVSPLRHIELEDGNASQEIALSWAIDQRLLPSAELFRRHVADLASAGQLPSPASADLISWRR